MVHVLDHLGKRRGGPAHLESDIETLAHAERFLRALHAFFRDVDGGVGAERTRECEALGADVGRDDEARADVPGDGDRHETDRAAAAHEYVFADERKRERRVYRIAERVEDRPELGRDLARVHPHVAGRQREVLGERAVAMQTETEGANAHLATAGATVAAGAADDVPLARDAVADFHVAHLRTDLDDLAVELVAGNQRCAERVRRPVVPVQNVQVGAADAGSQHANNDFIRPTRRV